MSKEKKKNGELQCIALIFSKETFFLPWKEPCLEVFAEIFRRQAPPACMSSTTRTAMDKQKKFFQRFQSRIKKSYLANTKTII